MWTLVLHDHTDTRAFGNALARYLQAGDVVLLHGDLGAGKTVLAQGIAKGLGVTSGIQSPTFTIVQEHQGTTVEGGAITVFHLDLYRLGGVEELEALGYERFIEPEDGISMIEWPERAEEWQPPRAIVVQLVHGTAETRSVTVSLLPDPGAWPTKLSVWLEAR